MSPTILLKERAAAPVAVHRAVRRNPLLTRAGLAEYVFARLFGKLVYPQIWEDPEVDMAALRIAPGHHVVAIASGGCNAFSYLLADPARVETVDLNPAHVAFNRLKLAALAGLPDHRAFYRFFGSADTQENIDAYRRFVRPRLDPQSLAYWEGRTLGGRKRISIFRRDLYRHGLLGQFIGWGHRVARLYGADPRRLLEARTMEEQRRIFDETLAPLFDKRLVRWATGQKSSLFGLGIPPQQYDALATAGTDMAGVLRARLERLACDFPLSDNYFAWQAFGRRYAGEDGPLPPYLRRESFATVRARAGRFSIENLSVTDLLAGKPAASVDRFCLLDAQDWMTDAQLDALWREITRTAAPGARVIFRTAAMDDLLPGRLGPALLGRWDYAAAESLLLHARDRSSIYGGFHLYLLKE